jgi:hypothetical protein
MLMVVFGAGASYDSSVDQETSAVDGYVIPGGDVFKFRPPLADQLFELRNIFGTVAQMIPKCQLILNQLRRRLPDVSVEQELEKLREESLNYPEGQRQLLSIQFYLQWIIGQCQSEWNQKIHTHTTYKPLLGQINRQLRAEPACLVTFNYDTLLEEAFISLGKRFESLNDYISRNDYKIIKPHGSVNWARELTTPREADKLDHLQMANDLIEQADTLQASDRYHLIPNDDRVHNGQWIVSHMQIPGKRGYQAVLPAIAIPVEKKNRFVCPEEHIKAVEECISKTDKLLIIGWKGAEEDFVKLLAQGLRKGIPKMLVSRSGESAVKIRDRLIVSGVGTTGEWICAGKGFAEEIRSGEIERFMIRSQS